MFNVRRDQASSYGGQSALNGGRGRQCQLRRRHLAKATDRSGSLAEIRRSKRRGGKPTSSRSSIGRARSVTMVLCASEDAPPFPLCARSACGASTAKRRVALPAHLAEGRPQRRGAYGGRRHSSPPSQCQRGPAWLRRRPNDRCSNAVNSRTRPNPFVARNISAVRNEASSGQIRSVDIIWRAAPAGAPSPPRIGRTAVGQRATVNARDV